MYRFLRQLLGRMESCNICEERMSDNDSGVIIDDFTKDLGLLLDKCGSMDELIASDYGNFTNAVTWHYFRQFPQRFKLDEEDISNISLDLRAKKYRLERVLEDPPGKYLFLIAHYSCIPDRSRQYTISLEDMSNPLLVARYSLDLKQKIWFNPEGWRQVLFELAGRLNPDHNKAN